MVKILLICFMSLVFTQAQNFNITPKDTALISDGSGYNDIWGFQKDNEDYVIIGKQFGFVVYKVKADGAAELIVQENSANNDNSTWGEYRFYNDHVIQSTESGPIRVYEIDFINKTSTYKGSFGRSRYHNISLYNDLLIGCGGRSSDPFMDCFDLSTSITNPTKRWEYTKNYVHDFVVQDDKIYMAELYVSNFAIYDISNVTTSTLGEDKLLLRHHYENGFTHNLWPTPDGKYLVTTDEHNQFDHLQWWDISDVNNVRNIAKIQEGSASIVHNAFIKNDFIYMSYYDRGLIIYDIKDRNLPVKIGEFDTYHQGQNHSNGTFKGAWGVYPYIDSNFVAVSDVSNGLFMVEFDQDIRAGKIEYTIVDSASGDTINNPSQISFLSTDKAMFERNGSKLIMKSVKDKNISFRIAMEGFASKDYSFSLGNNDNLKDTIRLKFTQLPFQPENLSVESVTSSSIRIQWEIPSFTSSFELFRSESENSGYTSIALIDKDSTFYTDSGLPNNKSYYYRLYAKNENGSSDPSETLLARTGTEAPNIPSSMQATGVSINSISLTWGDVDNETGYLIERSKVDEANYQTIRSLGPDSNSYIDSNLEVNQIYYYRVLAFNSVDSSAVSTSDSGKTFIPIPELTVLDSVLAVSTTEIRLKWRLKNYTESYKVYRSENADSNFTIVQTVSSNNSEYTDTGLDPYTWYYYKIVASNSSGDSDFSNTKGIRTISPDFEKPTASINLLKSTEISLGSFLNIYLHYSETLVERPTVTINGSSTSLIEFDKSKEIYQIQKQFGTDGNYTIQITATDLYENENEESILFNVKSVSSASSAKVLVDAKTILNFPANSFTSDLKFYTVFLEDKNKEFEGKVKISDIFDFPQIGLSEKSIQFEYRLEEGKEFNKTHLHAYDEAKSQWIRIPSQFRGNILISELSSDYSQYVVLYDDSYQFLPKKTTVFANFPNPFNPATTIRFDLAKAQNIQLNIYNILGQKIKTLYSGQRSVGRHEFLWKGKNELGQKVSSGVYFYRLITSEKIFTKRMILIK